MDRLQTVAGQLKGSQGQDEYRFTTPDGCLNLEDRKFYEENGYLIRRKFYNEKEMEAWRTRFLEYCDGRERPTGMQLVRDIKLVKNKIDRKGEAGVTKIQDWQDDEVLYTYCTKPELIPYLRSFCGKDVKSVHTMLINKPPNIGKTSRHPLHQDLAYFPFRPADRIVAVWAAMQAMDRENGCLVVYPGSHKGEFLEHGIPDWSAEGGVNKAYWGIKKMPSEDAPKIYLKMEPGDVVFFHPLVIHGSGANMSQEYRKSMCCHFASAHCKYIDIKGTIHEELADEIMGYARKKFFGNDSDFKFQDLWRFKSRLVEGEVDEDGI